MHTLQDFFTFTKGMTYVIAGLFLLGSIGFWLMLTGVLPVKDSVTGPLGIYFITRDAAQIGLSAILHVMALISMSLGIFNLLPLPVLDGGHLFFIAIEAVRRKPLSDNVQEKITQVGFVFIIVLTVLVVFNDFQRFLFHSKADTETTETVQGEK